MIRMKLLAVAEDAVTDQERNNISLFNVIEAIKPPGFPIVIPRLVVVAITERDIESDPNEIDLRVRIGVAGGKKLSDATTRISYRGLKRNRLTVRVNALVISEPGFFNFDIYHGKRRLGRYTIDVEHLDEPQIKAESGAGKKNGRKKTKKKTR